MNLRCAILWPIRRRPKGLRYACHDPRPPPPRGATRRASGGAAATSTTSAEQSHRQSFAGALSVEAKRVYTRTFEPGHQLVRIDVLIRRNESARVKSSGGNL